MAIPACTTSSTTAWRASKALYDGHAVAAVAAIDAPHGAAGAEADQGRLRGAAACHRCRRGDEAVGARSSTTTSSPRRRAQADEGVQRRQAQRVRPWRCRIRVSRHADVIVERSFKTEQTHQGYIEPHACLASVGSDGTGRAVGAARRATSSTASTAPSCSAWMPRSCASPRRRSAAASAARRMSGPSRWRLRCRARPNRPVKLVMTRDEVFRASGPTSSTSIDVKIGATQGRHHHRRRGDAALSAARMPASGPRSAP